MHYMESNRTWANEAFNAPVDDSAIHIQNVSNLKISQSSEKTEINHFLMK